MGLVPAQFVASPSRWSRSGIRLIGASANSDRAGGVGDAFGGRGRTP
jgi:hypothetical protein